MNLACNLKKKASQLATLECSKKFQPPNFKWSACTAKSFQPSFPLPPSATSVHLSISTGPSCREWHIGPRRPRQRCLEGHRGKTQRSFSERRNVEGWLFSGIFAGFLSFFPADFSHDVSDHPCSFHCLSDETRKVENTQGWKQKDSHVSWNKFTVTKKTFTKKEQKTTFFTLSNSIKPVPVRQVIQRLPCFCCFPGPLLLSFWPSLRKECFRMEAHGLEPWQHRD